MSDRVGHGPYIKILVQPASKALRFRYECEGRSAGSLPGANSTQEIKTYPTIQIMNYKGPAVVVVSCITKDPPYRPHPHKLVGKDGCKRGICTMTVNSETMVCTFSNLGIQCVKKKDVEEALREREEFRVDPFRTGFEHRHQASNIDLNSVRLCFQAFIEGPEKGKFTHPLTPVVSDAIYDKKAMCELVICKLSACSGSVKGGTEIILLCEKITKDDTDIVLSEIQDGRIVWEALGDFQPNDVHKQVAITFRTPPYHNQEIQQAVEVRLQLRRKSDMTTSEPRAFQYTPVDLDPEYLDRKRKKVAGGSLQKYLHQNTSFSSPMKMQPFTPFSDVRPVTSSSSALFTSSDISQRTFLSPHRQFIKKEVEPMITSSSPVSYVFPTSQFMQPGYQFPLSHSPVSEQMQASPNPTPSPRPYEPSATQTSAIPEAMNILTSLHLTDLQLPATMQSANPKPEQQEELQTPSLDLNFSIDSNDLNNLLPMSDTSINALVSTMSSSSFHLSSLESVIRETDCFMNQNEVQMNQYEQQSPNQQ